MTGGGKNGVADPVINHPSTNGHDGGSGGLFAVSSPDPAACVSCPNRVS